MKTYKYTLSSQAYFEEDELSDVQIEDYMNTLMAKAKSKASALKQNVKVELYKWINDQYKSIYIWKVK
ncbi:hypothetical protein AAG747_17655 [Rapidithrix thailandica]|uniref:Phage protein n=1 Tax=Rapidithrix thailandica TaxID=413964 RepID=A0AAW9SBL9_9BACT